MFPESFLKSFQDEKDIITDKYVNAYKSSCNPLRYVQEFEGLTDLLEYRDAAEQILDKLNITKEFPMPKQFMQQSNNKAQFMSSALHVFIIENLQIKCPWPLEYIDFVFTTLSKEYLLNTDPEVTLRPRLKTKIPELEAVIKEIETQYLLATKTMCDIWKRKLDCNSILPVIAILYCFMSQIDVDDTFLHCPPTKVLGAPCMYREATLSEDFQKVVSYNRAKQVPNLKSLVVCVPQRAYFQHNNTWITLDDPNIKLSAIVPGLEIQINETTKRRYYIFGNQSAVVYAVTDNGTQLSFSKKLEIDLEDNLDYLDCQRDRDNNIVLLFGKTNHNTGSIEMNYFAWSEEDFTNRKVIPDPKETKKLPNRSMVSTKVDFREHGNLISLLSMTKEITTESSRTFSFHQGLFFGNVQIPLEVPFSMVQVYGSPHRFVLLGRNGNFYDCSYNGTSIDATKTLYTSPIASMKDIRSMVVTFS